MTSHPVIQWAKNITEMWQAILFVDTQTTEVIQLQMIMVIWLLNYKSIVINSISVIEENPDHLQ